MRNEAYKSMNEELVKVESWLSTNKLSLNLSKTTYILFRGKKQVRQFPSLYMYGNPISRVECTKFLGIFIDQNLNWKDHANFVIGKLSRLNGILSKIGENLNLNSLQTLYFSFFQPSLHYGIIFWFSVSKSLQNKIFRQQKKAIRLINKSSFFAHTENLFIKNKILKFHDLYYLESCKFIYQEVNLCNNFHLVPHSSIHNYPTRSGSNLIPRSYRSLIGSNFVLSRGVTNYNNLSTRIKTLDSIDKFKCCLKLQLLAEYNSI